MKNPIIILGISVNLLLINQVQAEIYKCVSKGQTTFSDTPCPTKNQKCYLSNGKFGDKCESDIVREQDDSSPNTADNYENNNIDGDNYNRVYPRTPNRSSYYSSNYSNNNNSSYRTSDYQKVISGYTRSNGTHVNSYTRSSGSSSFSGGGGRRR